MHLIKLEMFEIIMFRYICMNIHVIRQSRSIPFVRLVVAVGDFGRRPHITASAVLLYF